MGAEGEEKKAVWEQKEENLFWRNSPSLVVLWPREE